MPADSKPSQLELLHVVIQTLFAADKVSCRRYTHKVHSGERLLLPSCQIVELRKKIGAQFGLGCLIPSRVQVTKPRDKSEESLTLTQWEMSNSSRQVCVVKTRRTFFSPLFLLFRKQSKSDHFAAYIIQTAAAKSHLHSAVLQLRAGSECQR